MKDERQRRVKCNYSSTIHVERTNIKEKKREISITTVHDYLSKLWMTLMLSLYDAISSTLMILSRSSSEFTNLIFLYSFFSYTCLESVYRICICLLCASYNIFYSKSREYFLHCYGLYGKSYSSVIDNHEGNIGGSHFPIFCRWMLLKRIRGQQLLVG